MVCRSNGQNYPRSFGWFVHIIFFVIISEKLRREVFSDIMVPHLENSICEKVMERLVTEQKPFKYIVSCLLMQRSSAACHSSTSCFWDIARDGVLTVVWPKDSRKEKSHTLGYTAICTVFGVDIDFNQVGGTKPSLGF